MYFLFIWHLSKQKRYNTINDISNLFFILIDEGHIIGFHQTLFVFIYYCIDLFHFLTLIYFSYEKTSIPNVQYSFSGEISSHDKLHVYRMMMIS